METTCQTAKTAKTAKQVAHVKHLLEIRMQRLAEEYAINAPQGLIEREYQLIQQAVARLVKLEGPKFSYQIILAKN